MAQNKFGLNNNPMSFRVLRTEKDSADVPTPQDPKLAALAQTTGLAGHVTPATPTTLKLPGTATDLVTQQTVGINRLLGQVASVGSQIRKPLNDLANASRQAGRAVRDVQGIIQQGALIEQDFNNAIGEAKKLGDLLGLTTPDSGGVAKDRYGIKYGSTLKKIEAALSSKLKTPKTNPFGGVESSKVFNRERIPWTLTTVADRVLGYDPIQFYVNPSKVSFSSDYVEVMEFVQSGNFYTRWRSSGDNKRAFPNLGVQFTFQSSNILPETYADSTTSVQETSVTVKGQTNQSHVSDYKSTSKFQTPPGIDNFYDILEILNAPTTIDGDILNGLSDTVKRQWDGQPNFVILELSTRTFPKMTVRGFFQQGWSLEEDAENPLAFTLGLKLVAFESDPPWWDRDQIMDRYNDTYRAQVEGSNTASTLADLQTASAAQAVLKDIQKSSRVDQKTLEGAAAVDQKGNPGPTKDAPIPGTGLKNIPASPGFGDDTQAGVAVGNISLREFTDTRSPVYSPLASYNVARVGDKVQTTLQLPSGENYVQYMNPNGSGSTSFTQGSRAWTSYTSAANSNGERTRSAVDGAGKQFFTGTF